MCTIINSLNANSGAIQAILVFVLVVITIWYASITERMKRIMGQQYKLSTRPYLYPTRVVDRTVTGCEIQLYFHMINVGNVPVEHYCEEIIIDNRDINPPKINTTTFPQQEGIMAAGYTANSPIMNNGDGLKGSIKIIFWAADSINEKYFFERKFSFIPGTRIGIESESFGKTNS